MHGHHTTFPRADLLLSQYQHPPSPDVKGPSTFPPAPLPLPLAHLIIPEQLAAGMELVRGSGHSTSSTSGCSSYGSPSSQASCATQRPTYIQRSASSHSFQKNGYHCHFASPPDFLDMETSPVRRVFSTGDLQHGHHKAESPLSSESNVIIESMSKACKYSPEEKKERIERYKSKRNQRNFTKKIKYACRKTLADSRPRIRGRFARNDEIEKNPQLQWINISGEEEDEENWVNFLDAFSENSSP